MTEVVLVDENDNPLGTMEKLEAHRLGLLHRAISVLVFNENGELLLQQRALSKYHGGGLWTNTCCSHPLPDEYPATAAKRRLREEMGIDLNPVFSHTFLYKADVGDGLWEHELDHVFTGIFTGVPVLNPEEAMDWKVVSMDELRADVGRQPHRYSAWLRIILSDPRFQPAHVA